MNNWIERNRAYTLVDAADNFSIAFAGMKFTDADLDRFVREVRSLTSGESWRQTLEIHGIREFVRTWPLLSSAGTAAPQPKPLAGSGTVK